VIHHRRDGLRDSGFLSDGSYVPGVQVCLANAAFLSAVPARPDLILTSPPYGDNHTTMPYGQASYLPLCWIDRDDIAADIPPDLLASSRSLDTQSLGGSRLSAHRELAERLGVQSRALARVVETLERQSHEAWQRIVAFFGDYARAWDSILATAKPDAHLVITLGDRTVRGLHIPTALITQELLEARGAMFVDELCRRIPHNKRIARRNETSQTIGSEKVLVMQRLPG